jgi:lysophospholipase L1-like esterase
MIRKVALVLAAALAIPGAAAAAVPRPVDWTATWATSQQRPGVNYTKNWSEEGFENHTVRQVVRISTGGVAARVRLSNAYGTAPLAITGATVARTATGAALRPGTLRHLTVDHARAFTVPAGAEVASDPIPLPLSNLDSVTVTLYFAGPTGPATYHAQSFSTSYRATGDHRADRGADAFTETTQSWYYLSGVDVLAGKRNSGVVAFGDSYTDGYGSTTDTNGRFPDELAERLAAQGRPRAVVNQGIGGNRVTVDSAWLGDSGLTRFRRDVLDQPGVGTVIVLAGFNDFGLTEAPSPLGAPFTEVSAEQVIAAHRELIRQAHSAGVRAIGATMPPFRGSRYYTEDSSAKRLAFNHWVRTSGEYDAVVDFAEVLAAPADPESLDSRYDSGDHLHPNDAGYRAMAAAVDPKSL